MSIARIKSMLSILLHTCAAHRPKAHSCTYSHFQAVTSALLSGASISKSPKINFMLSPLSVGISWPTPSKEPMIKPPSTTNFMWRCRWPRRQQRNFSSLTQRWSAQGSAFGWSSPHSARSAHESLRAPPPPRGRTPHRNARRPTHLLDALLAALRSPRALPRPASGGSALASWRRSSSAHCRFGPKAGSSAARWLALSARSLASAQSRLPSGSWCESPRETLGARPALGPPSALCSGLCAPGSAAHCCEVVIQARAPPRPGRCRAFRPHTTRGNSTARNFSTLLPGRRSSALTLERPYNSHYFSCSLP
mmetsp:Transcript_82731/g.266718  ORF Transcript_82731/g.266718 Transcript_82731/m.266718 type:complete len:308 (-) Transcript_82731:6-929(-)